MKKYILYLVCFCFCFQINFTQAYNTKLYKTDNAVNSNSKNITTQKTKTNNNYNGDKLDRNTSKEKTSEPMKRVYMHFTTYYDDVPMTREILLGFTSFTTDDYDYGYEAEMTNISINDFGSILDGNIMSIQAFSDITYDKVVPLYYKSCGNYTHEIKISRTQNIDTNQLIYLKDNLTNTYFDLNVLNSYQFTSTEGEFLNRFEVVFPENENSLNLENNSNKLSEIYYQNNNHKLFSKNLNAASCKITFINMLGQTVLKLNNISQQELSNGLSVDNLIAGIYIIKLNTDNGQITEKKILVN